MSNRTEFVAVVRVACFCCGVNPRGKHLVTKLILSGVSWLVLGLLAASAAPFAQAQAKQGLLYGYTSDWTFPIAQWDAFSKAVEASRPIKERLIADGTLLSWGADVSIVNTPDGFTHSEWVQARSLENLMKAINALSITTIAPPYTVATKHADALYVTLLNNNGGTASASSGFLAVSLWSVKTGRDQEFEALFKKYYQPWLDQMVAQGSALRYTFNTSIVHTGPPGLYSFGVVLRDEASYDKFGANVRTMLEQNSALHDSLKEITAMEDSRDKLFRMLAYQHK